MIKGLALSALVAGGILLSPATNTTAAAAPAVGKVTAGPSMVQPVRRYVRRYRHYPRYRYRRYPRYYYSYRYRYPRYYYPYYYTTPGYYYYGAFPLWGYRYYRGRTYRPHYYRRHYRRRW